MGFLQIFITGLACKVPINSGALTLSRDVVLCEHDESAERHVIIKLPFQSGKIHYQILSLLQEYYIPACNDKSLNTP